jgi:hypothetical protein
MSRGMLGAKAAREIKTKYPDYSTKLKELAEYREENCTGMGEPVAANSASCAVKVPFDYAICNRSKCAESNEMKTKHLFPVLFREVWHGGCP